MIFRVADYRDGAAVRADYLAFRDGFGRVIGPLGVKVGFDREQQFFDRRFVKYRNEIDTSEPGDDLGPLILGRMRTSLALQLTSLFVRIYGDNENIGKAGRTFQITKVAYVEKIEAPVGKNDLRAACPQISDPIGKLVTAEDLCGVSLHQFAGAACGV